MLRFPSLAVTALVLIAALPIVGVGEQLQASYVRTATLESGKDSTLNWIALVHGLIEGREANSVQEPSTTPPSPTDLPVPFSQFHLPFHSLDAATSGASGAGVPSAPSGSMTVPAVHTLRTVVEQPIRVGRLFLVETHFRLQAFASRLFRPPRD